MIEQSLARCYKQSAAETAAPFILASPTERPIHLGAIQLETLNLPRLFFEEMICIR